MCVRLEVAPLRAQMGEEIGTPNPTRCPLCRREERLSRATPTPGEDEERHHAGDRSCVSGDAPARAIALATFA